MADRICTTCGASNPADAEFCHACDAYIGWDGPAPRPDDTPAAGRSTDDSSAAPTSTREPPGTARPASTREAGTESAANGTERQPGPRSGPIPTGARQATAPATAAPVVSPAHVEATVTANTPARVELTAENRSSRVDGVILHADTAPPWLTVTHEDVALMPGVESTLVVTLAQQPGVAAVAQRFPLVLAVRSRNDPSKLTQVTVQVTVPPAGPPPTLTAQPSLVRLADRHEAVVQLVFDNSAANRPRRYRLAATDAAGAVTAVFFPPVVDVPAGAGVEAGVRLSAPPPAPGQQASHDVVVTAQDGEAPLTAAITFALVTAAPPERQPLKVRIEPSHLGATPGQVVAFDVLVDNRANAQDATIRVTGRDPQQRVGLSFSPVRASVPAGKIARVRGAARVDSAPPAGQSVSLPFTVVVNDGQVDAEASGQVDVTSPASAISLARLHVQPSTLVARQRRGGFEVDVDNRAAASALHVRLTGADEFGSARLTFSPPEAVVQPGQVARVSLQVDSPMPAAGSQASRRLRIVATDLTAAGPGGVVEAEAVLTQISDDKRPAAKRWLVVLGAIAAIAGGLWGLAGLAGIDAEQLADQVGRGDSGAINRSVALGSSALIVLFALVMLIGLNGKGRAIRASAILVLLASIAAVVTGAPVQTFALGVLGAVLGFVGGVLARPRGG